MAKVKRWRSNPELLALSTVCCWPRCEEAASEPPGIPLCRRHLDKAYTAVSDEMSTAAALRYRPPVPRAGGEVYFVQLGNRIKIGFSRSVLARLLVVPHDRVLAVVPGTITDERRCHAAFAHLRETGEWFRAEQDLLDFIADIQPKSTVS